MLKKNNYSDLLLDEDTFKQIVEKLPLAVSLLSADGIFLYANRSFYTMTGYEKNDLLKMNLFERLKITSHAIFTYESLIADILAGAVWYGEAEYFNKQMKVQVALFHITKIHSTNTNFILLSHQDITERKIAESILIKNENRYKSIFQNINEYIYSVEYYKGNPVYTYHSPKCEEITGYSIYEFETDPMLWYSIIHGADKDKVLGFINALLKTGEKAEVEHRIVHKNGYDRWVTNTCTITRDEEGEIRFMDGFIIDITEKRLISDELRKLYVAVDQSPASVIITDTKGNIEYVNPKFTTLTGYSFNEVYGKNPRILKGEVKPVEFYRDMWNTIISGKEWHGEFHNRKKNGETYWELAAITPIRDSNGVITNYLAVKEDITAIRSTQEKLQKINEELALKNDAMKKELHYAQKVQRALLPSSNPVHEHFITRYRFLPLEEVGGDYFSFTNINGTLGIFIADVVGHGVSAALFLTLLKYAAENIAIELHSNTSKFLMELNRVLLKTITNYFITAVYGLFYKDEAIGKSFLEFSNGGHPPVVIFRKSTMAVELMQAKGTIIGMFENSKYATAKTVLEKGDRVFLYTDGLPETRSGKSDIVGFDTLAEIIKDSYNPDITVSIDNIFLALKQHSGDMPFDDDILLVAVEAL